jgi:hypothetical protein
MIKEIGTLTVNKLDKCKLVIKVKTSKKLRVRVFVGILVLKLARLILPIKCEVIKDSK